ncbi:uncharacterized protein [Spinacia oleracea]|uniref:Retrotransposon gag domain-containing protein n=1 Tax=Spinacia oleracea TaxID=3562 RepID=A0ABM3RFU6_SPIOL|nr:uncharacterized protein LOC130469337 [Spinacia oleracea]
MSDTTKFHPALSINNVKSLISITLDSECEFYHSWVTLFMVQARVHNLMHHILPPTEEKDRAVVDALKTADSDLYERLDAVVLQWIYATVSHDLLQSILVKGDTAAQAWQRLEQVFQDNKGSRATHLEEELAAVKLEHFANAEAYCNHVQSLADRLAAVDAPVANSRLVLRLIGGLPEAYSGTVDYVQNQDPLPPFARVRSRIKLAERTMKHRAARESSGSALLASTGGSTSSGNSGPTNSYSSNNYGRYNNNNKNKKKNYGKGGGQNRNNHNNYRGGGGSGGGGNGGQPTTGGNQQQWQWQSRPPAPVQYMWPWHQWVTPPCPFPTAQWQPNPARPNSQPGLLGARPQQQAYSTSTCPAPSTVGYTPTDIEAAMHTLGLTPPDGNWYMDTGATSHMTSDQGFTDGEQNHEM